MPAKIKQGRYIDGEGVQQDVVFIGAEKAIFDDEGNRLDEKLESRSKASGLTVEDTEGILGVPEANVNFQALVDAVASKIMNELVTDSALTSKLADYVTKAMLSNSQVNDQNMVPTSALAYAMNQAITENADAITQLNGNLINGKPATPYYNVDSLQTLTRIFETAFQNIAVEEYNYIFIGFSESFYPFYGGTWFFMLSKPLDQYWIVTGTCYNNESSCSFASMSYFGGTWTTPTSSPLHVVEISDFKTLPQMCGKNRVNFFSFYRPSNSPFSFTDGTMIAINTGLLYDQNQFMLLGMSYSGTLESKFYDASTY